MEPRELFEYNGKKIILSNGPVSALSLEGLVIPMTPDLGVSMFDPFIGRMLEEARILNEDLLHLPDTYASHFEEQYGIVEKEGLPFQVPSRSAHLIEGHNGKLAQNLIYSCSMDVKGGQPYSDLAILKETVKNVLDVAEQNNIRTIGIPSLMSSMFYDDFQMKEIMQSTEEVVREELMNDSKLETAYLFCLPEGYSTDLSLMFADSKSMH